MTGKIKRPGDYVVLALGMGSDRSSMPWINQVNTAAQYELAAVSFKPDDIAYTKERQAEPETYSDICRDREVKAIFLDAQYNDRVVYRVSQAAKRGFDFITIDGSVGVAELDQANDVKGNSKLIAVTVLPDRLPEDILRNTLQTVDEYAQNLTGQAIEAGLDGVYSSPHELDAISELALPPGFLKVVAGIRLPDDPPKEKVRTATPEFAISHGADLVLLGRMVTHVADTDVALQSHLASIGQGIAELAS